MLNGKKILLGVCGSIAAYKSAHLIRLLVKAGAEVRVIMTESAKTFITPLTLSTLSKCPVLSSFEKGDTGEWNNHVELGLWADLMVIAPISANTLAKMANGLCDNLLLATYLSARCPVMIAPAMDLDMYRHPAVLNNLGILKKFGNIILDAESGELASGLHGQGRMAEPEHIEKAIAEHFQSLSPNLGTLKGKKVLITSGPTYEAIDPVRFIGNHSTGKMGHALAKAFTEAGCQVQLISGPTKNGQHTEQQYSIANVTSAEEMYQSTLKYYTEVDIAIFAAAVADYKPAEVAPQKIKKNDEEMILKLVKNKDIAFEMGQIKTTQFNVGFALETENEADNALQKLKKKNFDLIVLNSLNDQGAGFAHETNKVTIIGRDNKPKEFGLKSKLEVAKDIVNEIASAFEK